MQFEHRLVVEAGPGVDEAALGRYLIRQSLAQWALVDFFDDFGEAHIVVGSGSSAGLEHSAYRAVPAQVASFGPGTMKA